MLTIYRRHLKNCEHRSEGRQYRRCRCPIWVDGFIRGKGVRESLRTRSWELGQEKVRQWDVEAKKPDEATENHLTIEDAFEKYVADAQALNFKPKAIYRRKLLGRQMAAFAKERGLRYIQEFDLNRLRDFRSTWKNRNISASKKLIALRAFFRFFVRSKDLVDNPALDLDAPKCEQRPTLPFERDEMACVLNTCDQLYTDSRRRVVQMNARRIKALVLLLRYSGLRIGDAATLPVSRIADGKVFLRTAKTGTHVTCPLPPIALDALEACPRTNPLYFFWTGQCSRDTVARHWQSKLTKLFKVAKVPNGHAHRFRDTFAVEQLVAGTPLDQVSALLGHSSIKVTEGHYAPWVRARQEQMEASVMRSWESDPLIVAQPRTRTGDVREVHERDLIQ
jgi:integrase